MLPGRRRRLLLLLASVALSARTAAAATLFDPLLKFRVLKTEHFRIYFHQGEDRLARRLAPIAESAWRSLERPLATRPPALTHIVLADQSEQANGYATPLPYNTIVIYPTWPRGAEFDTDDWLRLVVVHEFTHIVHLDRSESWARALRSIFGRTFIAFPNLFLPTWQIEGLATYEESAITGEGRLHAGDFRVIVDEAARQQQLQPLDRVNGGLTDWPSGQGPYAYGVRFHQYLADRFSEEKLAELARATARRLPYTSSPVFGKVFGQSLGDLWSDFERSLIASATPAALDAGITRLTTHGFVSGGPRFDHPAGIIYSKRTPDAFPTLERIDDSGAVTTLASRYFGATAGIGRSSIYFDQLEFRRNVASAADLYALDRATGRVGRLTRDQRLRDPDLSPDGTTAVAVRETRGARELVLVDVDVTKGLSDVRRPQALMPTVLVSEADAQFNAPRFSPDGRRVAVERHRLGADPEIVVVDLSGGPPYAPVPLASIAGTRIVMPAWRPDGKAIVAAAAQGERVFNLYEFPVDGGMPKQLTHTTSGAIWPDVSPDGRRLAFVGYTTAGYDVFAMPYPTQPDDGRTLQPSPKPAAPSLADVDASEARTYSPLPTLRPTSWSPIVEWDSEQIRLGAALVGRDVLGYHAYAASATWLGRAPANSITPGGAAPDWFLSYAYDRWRPTLVAGASAETSFFAGPATEAGTPSSATRREHTIEAGVLVPFTHARSSHSGLLTAFRAVDDYTLPDRRFDRRRTAIRAGWRSATAKTYGYSISPEDGFAAGATSEIVRRGLGSSADATTVTADVRGYLPGGAQHHVIATRLAAGVSTGDPTVGRTFVLGGPGPALNVLDFGSGAISLLRGFGSNTFAGSHVLVANADYRWPIARPQRGYGTWPLFIHTVHAAAFVDAGHAWTHNFDARDIKTSFGAELSMNVVAGFYFPFSLAAGAAWGRDGSGTFDSGVTAYARIGRAF